MIALASVFSLARLKSNLYIHMERGSTSNCSGIPFGSPFPFFGLPLSSANIKHLHSDMKGVPIRQLHGIVPHEAVHRSIFLGAVGFFVGTVCN
jgi:hypothetical protein